MNYTYRCGFVHLTNGVPDLKSAGQPNNTTGLLTPYLSIPGRFNRLTQTLLPQTRPRRSIDPRIVSATPQRNFILITQRSQNVTQKVQKKRQFSLALLITGKSFFGGK